MDAFFSLVSAYFSAAMFRQDAAITLAFSSRTCRWRFGFLL